ncbi:MAG: sulfite reductase [Waddliaceae bacterium]
MIDGQNLTTKTQPYCASIKERYALCKPGSEKMTYHVVIDFTGSGIRYEVGDSLAVFPSNDPAAVQHLLHLMDYGGGESIHDKRSGKTWEVKEFLTKKANLNTFSRKFLSEVRDRQTDPDKKDFLTSLLAEGNVKRYQEARDVAEILEKNQEASFSPQEFCSLLMPMMPRFYSIASSMKRVGEEAHLTIALESYHKNERQRYGVCTDYLCRRAPMNESVIPIYIHSHQGFTLPNDPHAPIVMVGPGTGIAPFRAFMQERERIPSAKKNWLFFGECHRDLHFFYEEYWKSLELNGKLRLHVAFSRDQSHKIYVQHRMLEYSKELFDWLEAGAYFFVCGDAKSMAKEVEAVLHQIVQQQGKLSEKGAKHYIKHLRTQKRYLKDVY